jgi:UrcA family protein
MLRPILLSALGGLAAFSPNNGARAQEPATARVSYADLDLATEAGRRTLDHRIAWAVGAVCGDADIRDLDSEMNVRHCRDTAIAGAKRQVAALAADHQREVADRSRQGLIEVARSR